MKKLLTLLCIVCLLPLCSCSMAGKHEITDLAIITSVGLDAAPQGQLRVSLYVQSGSSQTENRLYAHTGDSISECLRKLAESCEKIPFFGHTEMIFVGPDMWENDLCSRLDWFIRSSRLRQECVINAIEGMSAEDFLRKALDSPVFINDAVKSVYHSESLFHLTEDARASRVMAGRHNPTKAYLIPCIHAEESSDGQFVPAFSGYALLHQGQVVCVTQEEESSGLQLLRGEPFPMRFAVQDQEGCMVKLQSEEFQVKKSIRSTDPLTILCEIQMTVSVLESYGSGDPALPPCRNAILSHAREELEQRLQRAAQILSITGSDAAGLFSLAEQEDPDFARRTQDNWPDVLTDLVLETSIHVEIAHSNQLGRPLGAKEENS